MNKCRQQLRPIWRGRFLSGFSTKLLLLVLLMIVPVFILVTRSNFRQRSIEKQRVRENALAISQLAAANQKQFIRHARQLLATLTEFPFLTLATNSSFCQTHFENLRKLSPDYVNFGLIDLDGKLICSAASSEDSLSLADRAYFLRVMETKRFAIGDFQVGRVTGQPSLNFGYPVFDESSKLARVIFASLKLSLLSDTIAQVPMPEDATITVIDRTGTVLARYPEAEKWVGQSLAQTPLVTWILREKEGIINLPGLDGVSRLHAVTPIVEDGAASLFVSVGIPVKTSFANANSEWIRNCFFLITITGILLIAGWWYARRFFLRPVDALVSAAERIGAGDLTSRTNIVGGVNELAALGSAFNRMAVTLEQRETELLRTRDDVARINAELELRVKERTAELAALNEELGAFSYSVSHDLRAPLRHIAGFVNLLEKKAGAGLDTKCQRYMTVILDSVREMGNLVDNLLSFSRMGRAEMRSASIDLEKLTHDIAGEFAAEMTDRKVVWHIAPLPQIEGDPALMRQVMLNLISNALKYSRKRSQSEVEVGFQPNSNGEHVIFVRDNGVGFDMKYAQKLFGVFQRLHSAEEFEGTGIGLANVQRIIARHGGRTWAEGIVNGGATFYFSIPKSKY